MTENVDSSHHLAATARWTASARAQESAREDRLFYDPWAAALAGPEGMAWLEQRGGSVASMVIRTRFFDDFLIAAAQTGIRQVVILAAGLDTRAYRLPWPAGVRVFEVDQAAVLADKAGILAAAGAQPACERIDVPADLTADWQNALASSGFQPGQPSAWLLEGILFYLPEEVIPRLLAQVSELAAPGSRIGFDVMNSLTFVSPLTRPWVEMQASLGAPWIGAVDNPEKLLLDLGWQPALTAPGAPDANYERWKLPVIPVRMPGMPHSWYVTGQKC